MLIFSPDFNYIKRVVKELVEGRMGENCEINSDFVFGLLCSIF